MQNIYSFVYNNSIMISYLLIQKRGKIIPREISKSVHGDLISRHFHEFNKVKARTTLFHANLKKYSRL